MAASTSKLPPETMRTIPATKDAAAKTATLRKLIDEWLPRMEGVETRDQLAEVLWENVQSKIDVATYGQ